MTELPQITEIQRLTLKPGDHLAVRVTGDLTVAEAAQVRARIMAVWPGIPVLVYPDTITLEVIEAASCQCGGHTNAAHVTDKCTCPPECEAAE